MLEGLQGLQEGIGETSSIAHLSIFTMIDAIKEVDTNILK